MTLYDQHTGHEFHLSASWFILTLHKLSEEVIKKIHFLTIIAKANANI